MQDGPILLRNETITAAPCFQPLEPLGIKLHMAFLDEAAFAAPLSRITGERLLLPSIGGVSPSSSSVKATGFISVSQSELLSGVVPLEPIQRTLVAQQRLEAEAGDTS